MNSRIFFFSFISPTPIPASGEALGARKKVQYLGHEGTDVRHATKKAQSVDQAFKNSMLN